MNPAVIPTAIQEKQVTQTETAPKSVRASFAPEHLARLAPFVAKVDIRYYLCGICIEKAEAGGAYLIATDGHTMVIVHDATATIEGAERLTIRVGPGLEAACKVGAKRVVKHAKYRLLVDGKRVKVACDYDSDGDAELFVQAGNSVIDGSFPDWRKVVPDIEKLQPGFKDGMNAHYLARLAKLTPDRRFTGVTLWQAEATKAILARVQSVPEMIVVMMPMRGDDVTASVAFKGFPVETVKAAPAAAELEAA